LPACSALGVIFFHFGLPSPRIHINSIPKNLKFAIAAGVGSSSASSRLKKEDRGRNSATLVTLGDLKWAALLCLAVS
jgi:xanthine/uracil/vitamin C permease (AzgA family)